MEKYWLNRPRAVVPAQATNSTTQPAVRLSDFDRHRQTLLMVEEEEEGWAAELRRYPERDACQCFQGDRPRRMVAGMSYFIEI